jgi:predicted GIY-YIG superfamily endonuclease
MKYVYLIQSIALPEQRYVGHTSDVDARIDAHNAGKSKHTAKYRPWRSEPGRTSATH